MADEPALGGWRPGIGDAATLADVVDKACDYRGDVTLVKTDGTEIEGYLFNRDRDGAEPFVQIIARVDGTTHTVAYARIHTINFTGRDTAAGNSYAAWRERRDNARAGVARGAEPG
ncbi:MAG: hypothetical protein ACREMG_02435, partial [Gemmatimonadales bacterium]